MGSPRASLGVRLFLAALGVIGCMGVLVFGAAGTLDYWQGWLFLADYFVANGLVGIWLLRHDRALLERRMRAGPTAETDPAQKAVMAIAIPLFLALLVVPGLGRRFDWALIPTLLVFVGAALIALSWWVIFLVFRENAYTAAVIRVEQGQTLVDTGPYALVRHPMYAGSVLLFLGIALTLGYWWDLAVFAAMIPVGLWRLRAEERMLARELAGYADYQARVRRRIVPFVW